MYSVQRDHNDLRSTQENNNRDLRYTTIGESWLYRFEARGLVLHDVGEPETEDREKKDDE